MPETLFCYFEVGAHEDTLEIDGVQLFPPIPFGHVDAPFAVTQVDRDAESGLRLRVTGYTFRFDGSETVTEAGTELLPMTFQITSVESMPVDPPAITINILKDSEGRLMIASFQTAQSFESSPLDQDKECKEWPMFCKWRAILADRINNIKSSMRKGCHRRPHHMPNPMEQDTVEGKPPHAFRPGYPHPHHHHRPHHFGQDGHHHHSHHRMHMFLRRAMFTILIPILIGIFAGTLTYLVGMALGCLIAIIVAKVRGQSPYQRIALDEEEVREDEPRDEKQMYAELPDYDSPPVYEEAAEKEVVEESK